MCFPETVFLQLQWQQQIRTHSKNISNNVHKSTVNSHLAVIITHTAWYAGGRRMNPEKLFKYNLQDENMKKNQNRFFIGQQLVILSITPFSKADSFQLFYSLKLRIMIRDSKLGCQPMKSAMGEGDWTDKQYLL